MRVARIAIAIDRVIRFVRYMRRASAGAVSGTACRGCGPHALSQGGVHDYRGETAAECDWQRMPQPLRVAPAFCCSINSFRSARRRVSTTDD